MQMISRGCVLGTGIAMLATSNVYATEITEKLDIAASEGPVALTRYAANQAGKRPAVIVLHGSRGFELRLLAYQRYADALTAAGMDVYLARYYGPADAEALRKLGTSEKREAYEDERYGVWTDRVIVCRDSHPGAAGELRAARPARLLARRLCRGGDSGPR